ncbi:MAG TPA: amidase, partial [Gemmataceae bacterium]|nr:amidase [Gemmataceae bacterium]
RGPSEDLAGPAVAWAYFKDLFPDLANFLEENHMAFRQPDCHPPIDDMTMEAASSPTRRQVLQALGALGIGSAVFRRALAVEAERAIAVTPEMIQQAEWISGLELGEEDRKAAAQAVQQALRDFQALRQVKLDPSVPPAIVFNPAPWNLPGQEPQRGTVDLIEPAAPQRPDSAETLAFLPVGKLATLVRSRQLSSVELTKLYLQRLRQYDPALHCVVTFTEELALKQAEQADREIAAGRYRGPLHGIPWGAKDLIAYPGYKTTWGAPPFKDQVIDTKATVARRLDEAGTVLVAKLALGALAQGDRWFGGMTRNPWNPKEGSSGSSAGSAAATAAGLVGFALGSETLGSIVSPCIRCGVTGLRPTFGRVSRNGCMTLSWSMDKVGPIARSVEDCALVFGTIHGADGFDPSAVDRPFTWPLRRDLRTFRVGYLEGKTPAKERRELDVLSGLGVKLVAIKLPDQPPVSALRFILTAEAATAFDDLTRRGITEGLNAWPRSFHLGQFIPAVEYIRANRIRTLLMRALEEVMAQVDAYVGGNDLLLANLTGHPTLVVPNGFQKRADMEVPVALTFTGRLFGEAELLALGHAYQQATGFHLRHPPMDKVAAVNEEKP